MTQSLLAQDPIKVLVESNSYRTPMIRSISSDGKYLEETKVSVQRNLRAEVQFKAVANADKLQGTSWEGATLRTIHDVKTGMIALMLSQVVKDTSNEKPFSQELQMGFEKKLYPEIEEDIIVRFPAVSQGYTITGGNGRIMNSWLGNSGLLNIAVYNETTMSSRLGSIDIVSKKVVDLEIERFYEPASGGTLEEVVFSDGKSFIDLGAPRIIRFTKDGTKRTDLHLSLGREHPKSITLGVDENAVLAAYEEGLIVWDTSGQQKLKSVPLDPRLYYKQFQGRTIAMLTDNLAIVLAKSGSRRSDAFLVDLNSGDILDTLVMGDLYNPQINALRLAASGKFACFQASVWGEQTKDASQAFCLKIEGRKLVGPWQIIDPQSDLPLTQVRNIVAATKAPILALETNTTINSGAGAERQRILIADLEKLTSKPAPPLRSARPK